MIRMFAGKTLISKVQKIYHKTLHAVLETYEKSYEDLLLMNDDISIHQNHLHFLATEIFNKSSIFNSINNLNPLLMWNWFSFKLILYESRKGNVMHFPLVPSTWHEINYLLFSGTLLGNILFPHKIKENNTTEVLKVKLKEIGNVSCICTECVAKDQRRIQNPVSFNDFNPLNEFNPLTVCARSYFLELLLVSEYPSEYYYLNSFNCCIFVFFVFFY